MKLLDRLRNRSQSAQAGENGAMSMLHKPLERVSGANAVRVEAERDERELLREEARYRGERLALYRARLYGGRAASQSKLRELERSAAGAAARLRRAEAAAASDRRRS